MKTEIYLSKEFLQHINNTVQPLPGKQVVILVSGNQFKVFNIDAEQNLVLAIYKPEIQVDYAPTSLPAANSSNGNHSNNHTTNHQQQQPHD